ncbi:putative uncharacterized protein DDB_G0282133 isoform X2 [Maniola jurtina]|uniref:putative uncharacterized protein DDB_G0282133 isoform X2 n=1 Tax=Maniola jurtina TaxID=191418 RepID=UPI001E689470|nr:putative uncharacterized protein DDB_G0282133 isoform X2 [Maniola jurtina]
MIKMYTQTIPLFFALHYVSAYTILQIELKNGADVNGVKELTDNTVFISPESKLPTLREIIFVFDKCFVTPQNKDSAIKKETPHENPIELDASLRSFTNGHGYQFADWELVDEHQSRTDDKVEDKTDNESESVRDDADHYDATADEKTDEPDDYYQVPEIPDIDPRHLRDIDRAKTLRNEMFDKIKEKYSRIKRSNVDPTEKVRGKRQLYYQNIPGATAQHNIDPTANPDYTNRMLGNRPLYDSSKNVMNPFLIDENGNILYDHMNTVYSGGRQIGSIPGAYGMNFNNDQGYYLNHYMQNEPIYNQHLAQPVQQRPSESYTLNNNPYKQTIQSNTPNVELRNVNQIPSSEIDDIKKLNQVPKNEILNSVPKEMENRNKNVTQVIDIEKTRNSNEANKTLRHNKEMLHNVNQMSKTIGSITEKFKDRFASANGILNTPEGRKFLTYYELIMAGDNKEFPNDIAAPYVHVNDFTTSDSKNLTKDDKLEIKPYNTVDKNHVGEASMHNNCSDKRDNANNSLSVVNEDVDAVIKEKMGTSTNNSDNTNTANLNTTEPTKIQTIEDNKCENPEPPAIEILTTTCNKTMSIEKDKESTLGPVNIESFNETSTTELKENKTETSVTNKISEENCKECNTDDDSKNDKKSENANLDDLFNKDEFWDWLSKWTSAYMEILNENIEIIVKEEVTKQLEEIFWQQKNKETTLEKATFNKSRENEYDEEILS